MRIARGRGGIGPTADREQDHAATAAHDGIGDHEGKIAAAADDAERTMVLAFGLAHGAAWLPDAAGTVELNGMVSGRASEARMNARIFPTSASSANSLSTAASRSRKTPAPMNSAR